MRLRGASRAAEVARPPRWAAGSTPGERSREFICVFVDPDDPTKQKQYHYEVSGQSPSTAPIDARLVLAETIERGYGLRFYVFSPYPINIIVLPHFIGLFVIKTTQKLLSHRLHNQTNGRKIL